jgi:hypothetical protein
MSAAEFAVDIAALALPAHQRARYREQWHADLRDAVEVGLTRGQIVRGAASFAAGSLSRALLRTELRASLNWVQVVVVAVLVLIYVYVVFPEDGLLGGQRVVLRDRVDVFSELMNTPFIQLSPVFIVFLSCTRYARELGKRFVSTTRSRVRIESYVLAKLVIGCGTVFVVFFAWTFLAFVVAFAVWPILGDPSISPHGYGLTTVTAVTDSFGRFTFSQVLASGSWTFGLLYSIWVGFAASVYAALGIAALTLIPMRPVAMAVPFLVFFGESVAAQLVGLPYAALELSMFPFGVVQQSILVGVAPTLILALAVCGFWLVLFRRLVTVESLA